METKADVAAALGEDRLEVAAEEDETAVAAVRAMIAGGLNVATTTERERRGGIGMNS